MVMALPWSVMLVSAVGLSLLSVTCRLPVLPGATAAARIASAVQQIVFMVSSSGTERLPRMRYAQTFLVLLVSLALARAQRPQVPSIQPTAEEIRQLQ